MRRDETRPTGQPTPTADGERERHRDAPASGRNPNRFETVDEVERALRRAGLESCQIIVGIDFSKSNASNGDQSLNGHSRHSITGSPNSYGMALDFVARALKRFVDDNLIPCYGFGDVRTNEGSVFSFFSQNDGARGFDVLLRKYEQIAPLVELSNPTSFEPLIRHAMRHVYHLGMQFHLLMILTDGQISAECRSATTRAIRDASSFPMFIVVVGVGDGPWDEMHNLDTAFPQRRFKNFQFVEYNKIMNDPSFATDAKRKAAFALQVLSELPEQYKIAEEMMGPNAKSAVRDTVAQIPPSILIEPPSNLSLTPK